MKTKLSLRLLLMLMISLTSCEKREFKNDIAGTWEIVFAGGGFAGVKIETNFNYLRLKTNNNYFIYSHDTLKASGKYSLFDSGYEDNNYFEPFYIRFNKGSKYDPNLTFPIDENLDMAIIKNDTLIFSERQVSDSFEYAFIRSN